MACVGAIAGAMTALVLASAEPVLIATTVPHPPYAVLDASGGIAGFDRDIGDEVCRRAALHCDWVAVRFDVLLAGVASGDYDIGHASIAVLAGTIHESHLRTTGRNLRSYGTEEAVLDAVRSGETDLAFGIYGGDQMTALADEGLTVQSSEQVAHGGTAMAVCKGNDALRRQLDAAIAAMLDDGTIDKIAQRWAM
jgi:ABC-type amino acid transport substrate-binding protein